MPTTNDPSETDKRTPSFNRRTFLRRLGTTGLVTAGASSLASATDTTRQDKINIDQLEGVARYRLIGTITNSPEFHAINNKLPIGSYPKVNDATALHVQYVSHNNFTPADPAGRVLQIPYDGLEDVAVVGFVPDGTNRVAIVGTVNRPEEEYLRHYTDSILIQSDSPVFTQYFEYGEFDTYTTGQTVSLTSISVAADHPPIPGYDYVGTYDISLICTVFGIVVLLGELAITIASPIPGDAALVLGSAGGAIEAGCALRSILLEFVEGCNVTSTDVYVDWLGGDYYLRPNCTNVPDPY